MTKSVEEKEQELIPFTRSTLPILEFSFDDIKQELTTDLAKYKGIVVTLETMKEDKKLAQELKAKGKSFNDQRKAKVKEISAPIELFTDQMAELTFLCTQSSELISKQVAVFEKEQLVVIADLLIKTLGECREESKIDKEFQVCQNTENLVKLGAVTAKGVLTKGSKDKLLAIVANESALQNTVNYRLLQLENESHKAGLTTPLVRLNVEHFLLFDNEDYNTELAKIVASEVTRQEVSKEAVDAAIAEGVKVQLASTLEKESKPKMSISEISAMIEEENIGAEISGDGTGEALPEITGDVLLQGSPATNPEQARANLNERFGAHHVDLNNNDNQEYNPSLVNVGGHLTNTNDIDHQLSNQASSDLQQYENNYQNAPDHNDYADQMLQEQQSHAPEHSLQLKEGNVLCIAVATFKVSVPHQITEQMVQDKIVQMLTDAGIDTLDSVVVTKHA